MNEKEKKNSNKRMRRESMSSYYDVDGREATFILTLFR